MRLSYRLGRAGLASAFTLALISGCSGSTSPSRPNHPDTSTGGLHITKLLAVETPNNVLAYDVSWTTSRAADTELDVDCGSSVTPWTISDSTASTTHHVFLMGLVTGVSCGLTAKAKSADGGTASSWKKITVSDLPGYLPPIDMTKSAKDGTIVPGWTLINLSNEQPPPVPYIAALLDRKGRYRWYYQYPSPAPGNDTPVFQYKDGVVIGGRDVPLSYVTWQGELVWADDSGEYFHHEARLGESPNRFYTLGNLLCPPLVNYGDYIVEYDSDLKQDVWKWSLCDHYTPPQDVPDWGHLNTVSLFPDHQFLLSSSRNQNAIFKINRATGDLIWTMGFHGDPSDGFHGDFAIADADRFYQQHDTTILPNGHILMFDNGYYGVRDWSRAAEVAYTYNPGGTSEAHVVWQFRHDPDIFAPIWGSTQRFDNGNTLVCFGQRDPGVQSTIDEVSADSELLWEFTTPEFWGVYRAERVPVQHGKVIP